MSRTRDDLAEDLTDDAGRWVCIVRGTGDSDVPVPIRVKRWLKAGLRGYGLRCISVSSTTPQEQLERLQEEVVMLKNLLARAEAPSRETCTYKKRTGSD